MEVPPESIFEIKAVTALNEETEQQESQVKATLRALLSKIAGLTEEDVQAIRKFY